jgi:hypothetical protein
MRTFDAASGRVLLVQHRFRSYDPHDYKDVLRRQGQDNFDAGDGAGGRCGARLAPLRQEANTDDFAADIGHRSDTGPNQPSHVAYTATGADAGCTTAVESVGSARRFIDNLQYETDHRGTLISDDGSAR